MNPKIILFLSIIFLTILTGNVQASVSDEYLNEFNITNESCHVVDSFVYDIANPWFFNSERKYTTYPLIYSCCIEDSCTSIILDANHKTAINDKYLDEIIDLNYIRYNLYSGNLSTSSLEIKGLDLCGYFGFNDVKKESLNLASEFVESGASMVKTERAYKVVNTISTARKVGIIGEFNPTLLIAGGACSYDNKKLNNAFENLFILNSYLRNINNGYCREGYVSSLTTSIALSKQCLDEYIQSPTAMIRGGANFFLNMFKFLFETASKPTEAHQIEKTEYGLVQDIRGQISNYDNFMINPNKAIIIQKNDERLQLKSVGVVSKYNPLYLDYKNVSSLRPSYFGVVFTNMFFNPNYNLSEGEACFRMADESLDKSNHQYIELKFNSAIASLNGVNESLTCAGNSFIRENAVKRSFDMWWLLIFLIILVIVFRKKIFKFLKKEEKALSGFN